MKNKTTILTLAAVAVLAFAALSFAGNGRWYGPQGPGAMGGYGPGHGFARMGSGYGPAANLTDEQRTALEKATLDHAAKVEPLRADLNAKHLELAAELAKSAPDQARVGSLTKEVNDLRGKLFTEQTAFRTDLAKTYGIHAGPGMGYGRGYGHGLGMRGGFGPGNCPYWGGGDSN